MRRNNPKFYHGSHFRWTGYDLGAAHALGTGKTSPFDNMGLWLTSDQSRARNYGPQVIGFEFDIVKPFVIKRQGSYQPFAEGLWFEDIGQLTLKTEDYFVIKSALHGGDRELWEDDQFKMHERWNADMELRVNLTKAQQRAVNQQHERKRRWNASYRNWLRNAGYWNEVKARLLDQGYDAIVFANSIIDNAKGDSPHDVVVYLKPELLVPKE